MKERILVSGSDNYNTQLLYFTCSSLSDDDRYLYMITDRTGHVNVAVKDLQTGEERLLTDNKNGVQKSYVYFDGDPNIGISKAGCCLDCHRKILYYIQDNLIKKVDLEGHISILNKIPAGRTTAFNHVSEDGKYLCVPMTDGRALDYDPQTEGEGLDLRPKYNIDRRVQEEHLSSYLCVYDTETGSLVYEKEIPNAWITHVQFNPTNPHLIMYNHEWPCENCGIRRIWLYDREKDTYNYIRKEGPNQVGEYARSKNDWVCHEMWSDDGKQIIYHGGYENGPAMVGMYDTEKAAYYEMALPKDYNAYGHFLMNHQGILACDGYFKFPHEIKPIRENSTDNGPDPHKKDAEYISQVIPNWKNHQLRWLPLCKHQTDWLGQDSHPHPIYSHVGDKIFFSSRVEKMVKIYQVDCEQP